MEGKRHAFFNNKPGREAASFMGEGYRIYEEEKRTPFLVEQLLTVWENSVRATYLFLSESEIYDKEICTAGTKGGRVLGCRRERQRLSACKRFL